MKFIYEPWVDARIRAEYSTVPDTAIFAEELCLNIDQLRWRARHLGVRRDLMARYALLAARKATADKACKGEEQVIVAGPAPTKGGRVVERALKGLPAYQRAWHGLPVEVEA